MRVPFLLAGILLLASLASATPCDDVETWRSAADGWAQRHADPVADEASLLADAEGPWCEPRPVTRSGAGSPDAQAYEEFVLRVYETEVRWLRSQYEATERTIVVVLDDLNQHPGTLVNDTFVRGHVALDLVLCASDVVLTPVVEDVAYAWGPGLNGAADCGARLFMDALAGDASRFPSAVPCLAVVLRA